MFKVMLSSSSTHFYPAIESLGSTETKSTNQFVMDNNRSNQSTHSEDEVVPMELTIFLYVSLMVCSIFGNMLVIIIFCRNPHMRTNFNYLVVNMAVSDLIIPLITTPMGLTLELTGYKWMIEGPLGEALCKLTYFLSDTSPGVSVYSLVIIAINRFVAIVFPMHVRLLNKKTTSRIFLSLPWVISFLFSCYILYFNKVDYSCMYSWEPFDNFQAMRYQAVISLFAYYIIPLTSITTLYFILLYKIYQSSENVSTMIQDNRSRKYRDRQIFYLSIAIIVAFALLWGPLFISNVYTVMYSSTYLYSPIRNSVVLYLAWANTAVNPMICILFNGNFRQGFKRLLKGFSRSTSLTTQIRPTRTTRQTTKDKSTDRYQVVTAL